MRLERIVTLAWIAAAAAVLASIVIINAPEPAAASPGVRCAKWATIVQVQKDLGPVGEHHFCTTYEETP